MPKKLSHHRRVLLLALLSGLPAASVALALLWRGDFSSQTQWSLTVLMLPLITAPLVVVMNDRRLLKTHTNGWISNCAVVVIVLISFVLALLAIPVQLMGA